MEFAETMAFIGLQIDLVLYLINKMNFAHTKAATTVTNFAGTAFLCPLFGGFLADAYLGRVSVVVIFGCVELVGMSLMVISASLPSLRPLPCGTSPCKASSSADLAVLYLGMYLIALGSGGLKPCLSSLGADQFDETHEKERRLSAVYFNWYFFSFVVGGLLGVTVLVYIQDNIGYDVGYGICLALVAVSLVVFVAGFHRYRRKPPSQSPLTRILQVIVAAFRKLRSPHPPPEYLYEIDDKEATQLGFQKIDHTSSCRFLDRAAIVNASEKDHERNKSKWELCTVTQVEETKAMAKLMPIWTGTIIMNVVLAQLQTFTIEQGSTMDRKIGSFNFPAASIPFFPLIIMANLVPLYDRIFVPVARRFTGLDRGITFLQRIGIGLVLSVVSMIIAAVVEVKRTDKAKAYGLLEDSRATIPMSIFWLVPQYFTFGIADMFTFIGVLEFFYDQAPDSMRSTSTGFSFCTISLGYFISSAVVSIVNMATKTDSHPGWLSDDVPFNRKKLNLFYWLMAVLSFVNFAYFLVVAHFYRYKKYPSPKFMNPDAQLQKSATPPVDSACGVGTKDQSRQP
ncbi:protein NRT1/ PTR FAMILY 8.2 isoform X2 [Physcomitrium patens]|nr:protein NRT1/ PTR FAMILY 8.2-like isoform X2 [Physcomitrium patens]|eukprot:XP_024400237.1 protein NRT1/ PTR FAMILY 8.2-like isoform X2 [Physcomitrella patens]